MVYILPFIYTPDKITKLFLRDWVDYKYIKQPGCFAKEHAACLAKISKSVNVVKLYYKKKKKALTYKYRIHDQKTLIDLQGKILWL